MWYQDTTRANISESGLEEFEHHLLFDAGLETQKHFYHNWSKEDGRERRALLREHILSCRNETYVVRIDQKSRSSDIDELVPCEVYIGGTDANKKKDLVDKLRAIYKTQEANQGANQ